MVGRRVYTKERQMLKKIKVVAKNVGLGALVGSAVGTALIPFHLVTGLTAPVSFPLIGALSGYVNEDTHLKTSDRVIIGTGVGICLIPWAPIHLVLTPFNPITYGALGGLVGVGMGLDELKKKETKKEADEKWNKTISVLKGESK